MLAFDCTARSFALPVTPRYVGDGDGQRDGRDQQHHYDLDEGEPGIAGRRRGGRAVSAGTDAVTRTSGLRHGVPSLAVPHSGIGVHRRQREHGTGVTGPPTVPVDARGRLHRPLTRGRLRCDMHGSFPDCAAAERTRSITSGSVSHRIACSVTHVSKKSLRMDSVRSG